MADRKGSKSAKLGRKTKYEELNINDKLDSIQGWAKNGSTDKEIADMLGIGMTLYYEWKKTKTKFANAIKKGKEVSNGELLNSAFTQSTGFYYTEKVPVKVKDYREIDGKWMQIERVEVIEIEKYSPPNPTMNIFMLKNRMPEQYRDKQDIDLSGDIKINITLEDD